MRDCIIYSGLMLLVLLCAVWILSFGDIPFAQAWQGAQTRLMGLSSSWNPLLDERLPRLIVLFCTGASLAVSGAIMQSIFQNPLASPSVLGISCGGSLLVLLVFLFEWHLYYPYAIPMAAVIGCLLVLLLLYLISLRQSRPNITHLIMISISLSTLLIAIQGAIMYAMRDHWDFIQTVTEWEGGSSMHRTWKHVHMQLPLTLIGLIGCWRYRREIDLISLGEEQAENLGVDVVAVRWRIFLYVSLLTGGALAAVGMIAFFGLILPHIVRRIQGNRHDRRIPLCILVGSLTLMSMDMTLRYFQMRAFSIGNISAVLGGLFFLLLITNNSTKQRVA